MTGTTPFGLIGVVALLWSATSCTTEATVRQPEEFLTLWVQALNTKDLDTVRSLISEDPATIWVNSGSLVGREAMVERINHWFTSEDVYHWSIDDVQLMRVNDKLAAIVASVSMDASTPDLDYKYLATWTVILEHSGGGWHLLHLNESMKSMDKK